MAYWTRQELARKLRISVKTLQRRLKALNVPSRELLTDDVIQLLEKEERRKLGLSEND